MLKALHPSVEKLIPAMAMELDNYSPWCEDPRMFVLCFFKNTSGHSKRSDFLFTNFPFINSEKNCAVPRPLWLDVPRLNKHSQWVRRREECLSGRENVCLNLPDVPERVWGQTDSCEMFLGQCCKDTSCKGRKD